MDTGVKGHYTCGVYCKHCGADLNGGNRCKCGKVHTGSFAWLIKFFHSIQYFFKNLFK